jgi:hypothetical protein
MLHTRLAMSSQEGRIHHAQAYQSAIAGRINNADTITLKLSP